ncbi:hypothetical protein H8959_022289 [Pygathrix nigripes]
MGRGLLLHRARSTPVLPQGEGAWGSISSSQCQQSPCPATLCLTQAVWAPWGGARHGSASLRQHLSLRFHILWGWERDRQVCCGAGRWEGSGRREPSGDPSDGWDTIPSRNGYSSRSESQGEHGGKGVLAGCPQGRDDGAQLPAAGRDGPVNVGSSARGWWGSLVPPQSLTLRPVDAQAQLPPPPGEALPAWTHP